MSTPTITSLDQSVKTLQTTVRSIQDQINQLSFSHNVNPTLKSLQTQIDDINEKLDIRVTTAELQTAIGEYAQIINDFNSALADVEEKVKNILLPTDTRFYLEESEISDFRSNFRMLRALMTDLEKSRQAFIKLSARYNLTNSTI